jgi:GlpG protein
MRMIGSLPTEQHARRFGDYLLAQGMNNTVEQASSGWAVWVHHDDHLERAGAELAGFRASPDDPKYAGAGRKASRLRTNEQKRADRQQRKYRDVRTRWGTPEQWNVPLTLSLIVLAGVVAAVTFVGSPRTGTGAWIMQKLFISEHFGATHGHLIEVRHGQVWRLITPIFLHFGPLHLIFNLFWLRDLGGMIERERGTPTLAWIVFVGAFLPNLAQYWAPTLKLIGAGMPFFGGLSGVVYALFGYVWIKGKLQPSQRLGADPTTVYLMLGWLALTMFTDIMPNIGNAAHLGGLSVGIAMAWTPWAWRKLRPRS